MSEALGFANPKCHDVGVLPGVFPRVAGLAQQIGNIDAGEWIGARDDDNVALGHAGERLARAQYRQRAFEAVQIESLFRHRGGSQTLKTRLYYSGDDGAANNARTSAGQMPC